MLTAQAEVQLAGAALRTRLMLERGFRAHVVWRDQLTLDTGVLAATRVAPRGTAYLYLVLRGEVGFADGRRVVAPAALALTGAELDQVTPTTPTFRVAGPSVSVELALPVAALRHPPGLATSPIEASATTWAAIAALVDAREPVTQTAAMAQVLGGLLADGVLAAPLAASIVVDEPERITRIWRAVAPLYGRFETSASLTQLQDATGLSLRQLGRDIPAFLTAFNLTTRNFRDLARVMRLRAAAILLSAPGASVGDVATTVGYASLDAMARAFRDAKLPPPTDVRRRGLGSVSGTMA